MVDMEEIKKTSREILSTKYKTEDGMNWTKKEPDICKNCKGSGVLKKPFFKRLFSSQKYSECPECHGQGFFE